MNCNSDDGYLRDREKVGKSVLVLNIVVMVRFWGLVGDVVVVYNLLNCIVDELKPSILFHGHRRQIIVVGCEFSVTVTAFVY